MRIVVSVSILLLLFTSCKTAQKQITETPKKPELVKENTIALSHQKTYFTAQTLQAKLETIYDDGDKQQSITIKLRLEKDKVIWMSGTFLGVPVAKILITPHRIQYYEKINKTYFDGDFSLFEKVFGVALSFEHIQNMLLGQAFFDVNQTRTQPSPNSAFVLVPEQQNPKFDIFYYLNPQHFKLEAQEAVMSDKNKFKVQYNAYQTIDNQLIPSNIIIYVLQNLEKTTITFDVKNVELNQKLTFPFDMPQGYDKLNFEK